MIRHRRRTDRGFSLVEVVVALFILAIAGAALAQTVNVSMSSQSREKVRHKQLSIAEAIFQEMQIDTSWTRDERYCPAMRVDAVRSVTCENIASHFEQSPALVDGRSAMELPFRLDVSAVGLDNETDGLGLRDLDGARPDYYRVTIRVWIEGRDEFKAVTVGGTISPSSRANSGVLVVQVCRLVRQYDRRQPVGACPERLDNRIEDPAGTRAQVAVEDADLDVPGTERSDTDWDAVLGAAASDERLVTYGIHPVEVRFRVTRQDGPIDAGAVLPQPDRECTVEPPSSVTCETRVWLSDDPAFPTSSTTIAGLRPGTYRVDVLEPGGYETWSAMSVPSGGVAVVEPAVRSRVIVVLRPSKVDGYTIDLEWCDRTDPSMIICYPEMNGSFTAAMRPASNGRANFSRSTQVSDGDISATFSGLPPGLYAPVLVGPQRDRIGGKFDVDKTGPGNVELVGNVATPTPCMVDQPWRTPVRPSATCGIVTEDRADELGKFLWIDPRADGLGSDIPVDSTPTRATFTVYGCDPERRLLLISYLETTYGVDVPAEGGRMPAGLPDPWGDKWIGPCRAGGAGPQPPRNDGNGGT